MNGQKLYNLYVLASQEQDIDSDGWNELTENERAVWNRTVELLAQYRLNHGQG